MEPVTHFLPRQAAALGGAAGQRLVDDLEPLPGAAIGGVERDELVGELRLLQRRAFELFGGQRCGGEQRVGGGFAQRPGATIARVGGDFLPFEREQLLQAVEERGGQRAVVMLDLAEVGGRDGERSGEVGLLDAAILAQGFEARASEDAVTGYANLRVSQGERI